VVFLRVPHPSLLIKSLLFNVKHKLTYVVFLSVSQVTDAIKAIICVGNYMHAISLLSQSVLRSVVGESLLVSNTMHTSAICKAHVHVQFTDDITWNLFGPQDTLLIERVHTNDKIHTILSVRITRAL
jgi:hypothetical protein